MPRASWSGFLRLSLVSCPIYLSPATTRTKSIRLHQVWRPAAANEPDADLPDRDRDNQVAHPSRPQVVDPGAADGADQTGAATRIALRPHDPRTGEEIEKSQVVKGYECDRGQFVTFSADELKAFDVESSKVIDLERFVSLGDIDPVYFDTPYYLYPDGPVAVEALRVIGVAMAEAGVAGIGRLTLSRRERMVVVEPRDVGMALFTFARCRGGSVAAVQRQRGRSRCRDGGDRPRDHQTAHREIRSEHLPRPPPGGIASAHRGQVEGPVHQTPRGHHAATGDRSDGGPETQSRTGNACSGRHDGQEKASQARGRSAPAIVASARSRRPKMEGEAPDRASRRRRETAKEGVNAGLVRALNLRSAARSASVVDPVPLTKSRTKTVHGRVLDRKFARRARAGYQPDCPRLQTDALYLKCIARVQTR